MTRSSSLTAPIRRTKNSTRGIVKYLLFLHCKARTGELSADLIKAWYRFPEIKENWLGFSAAGNEGRGLGKKFAVALHTNLHALLSDFGQMKVAKGIQLEKLCLVSSGVGKDSVSDFTNNLIHQFLLEYTQAFAVDHVAPTMRRRVRVSKVRFNYDTETWQSGEFELPVHNGRHVLLTPLNILTKENTWINKTDLVKGFSWIPDAISNDELRGQINNYFRGILPNRPTTPEQSDAVRRTLLKFPTLPGCSSRGTGTSRSTASASCGGSAGATARTSPGVPCTA